MKSLHGRNYNGRYYKGLSSLYWLNHNKITGSRDMDRTGWISIIITFLLSIIAMGALQYETQNEKKEFSGRLLDFLPKSKKRISYCILMVIGNIGLAAALEFIYIDHSLLFHLKRLCLISVLWPIAFIDYKSCRIPNNLIFLGLAYRGIILIGELFIERESLLQTITSEGIAVAGMLILSVLCMLLMRGSLGMGDVKLFMLMGLCQGLSGIIGSVFLSLIVSFIAAVFLLITRKKSRKDAIPFGPAVLTGTYISVFLLGA